MVESNPVLRAQVNGAGPTGALAALALAEAGWQVEIHDPLPAATLLERSRAYAFSHSSQRLLTTLGVWEPLQQAMVPFRSLQLLDLAIGQQVPFGLADLGPRLAAAPGAAVGWVAQHRPLMTVLLERLAAHPAIRLALGTPSLSAAGSAPADLIVAADGPHSPTRSALGIGALQWAYRQNCLTALVQLRGSADDQAWELFRPEGPFAILPLGEGLFQLVWSAPAPRCRQLESLGDAAFLDALAGALPDRFQPDALLDDPRAFPVSLLLAHRLHRGTTVLVGESGHRCHPVGGQGLNLCWRDVAQLHRLARRVRAGGLAVERLPAAYGLRRWPDLLLTLVATDLLVRLFSNRSPLLLPLRRLALLLLARLAPLRRLSLAAMTQGPCQLLRP
ncbi:FAD-dependent monooxygenase [Cyanobium sp. FACHB-13342]|uniref:FAD-dependent monooxygenase n=1 Tax=Cyanobium sp. FACHB-13342 TaxID=2692793 RepID=UPI001680F3DC|nr:FAD-dependent monooxygenase [Cyanobium sp. FACHB-13342]MBD2422910.1 FAD-dependent monooxygenase [Cyanobium sp. FACHB-13342]